MNVQSGSNSCRLRIGGVSYLNSRPLLEGLSCLPSAVDLAMDLPSRLASRLAAGQLDAALVPSIEYFRRPGYVVVSDACVACDGPVRSVKLYGRVPVERIESLALDEGSRTSAALARILLAERFGIRPRIEPLAIGRTMQQSNADAVMLIGDRGMLPPAGSFEFVWDLGEEWRGWSGLPFVFAMWVARAECDLDELARVLGAARDEGCRRLEEIARCEAPRVGLPEAECLAYFRENLRFSMGPREEEGLGLFYRLAERHGLAPAGVQLVVHNRRLAG
jgi:chorismate dehydratase